MTTEHYVDDQGNYLGGFGDGAEPPAGSKKVSVAPSHGRQSWDGAAWYFKDEVAAEMARAKRDDLLKTLVDPIATNPLRWDDLSAEKQEEWANYRRQLLAVPEQPGFPHNVLWPVQPE